MWLSEPLPSELRLCAADALYNLRSALDQAVCCCAKLAGKSPKGTYFPHGENKAGFEASLRSKCNSVPEPIRNAIAALEPFHGGNGYLLRVLHDLNVIDKHTDLITIGVAVHRAEFWVGGGLVPTGEVWRRTADDKFERLPAGEVKDVGHQFRITVGITFADSEAIQGQSATRILTQLSDLVAGVVELVEVEMNRYLASGGC
jgi:hypothetical protein